MSGHHEMAERFRAAGLPLDPTLEAMLDEDPAHRSERRGCGLTQATRYLAERANAARDAPRFADLAVFAEWRSTAERAAIDHAIDSGAATDWRGWDRAPPAGLGATASDEAALIDAEAERQRRLRRLPAAMTHEESALVAGLIRDLVLPEPPPELPTAPAWPERLPVGSCPTGEKCFLELAHGFVPRKARINLIHDPAGRPLLIEKLNMGDDHSCISLEPLRINGVAVPAGALFAVRYDASTVGQQPNGGGWPGAAIPLAGCQGLRLLRLTTLAVSPAVRARAFSAHLEAQLAAGLFEPDTTELADLRRLAERELV